jgi:putative flavoprotein involved in K+ transport
MHTASRHHPHHEERVDVLVIGAGQSGLVTGYYLARTGCSFRLLDRMRRIGDSWRRRHDSLVLFSPRTYCSLPGLAMDGDPEGYPTKVETADYLEHYADDLRLPLALAEGVVRLERHGSSFVARTDAGRVLSARAVVVASGPFQQSIVPPFASALPPEVVQLTVDQYRNPTEVPSGRVLVVGGGSSGRQIARELATDRQVTLSVGQTMGITPQRVMGRDVMVWFDALGFLRADKATWQGRFARAHDSFPGLALRDAALRRHGVRIVGRTIGAAADGCRFEGGSTAAFDAVIWAIGFRDDSTWLGIDGAVGDSGQYSEDRGVCPVPGLFFVGRSWQTCRASALLCGVADDAARIVGHVEAFLTDRGPRRMDVTPAAAGAPV